MHLYPKPNTTQNVIYEAYYPKCDLRSVLPKMWSTKRTTQNVIYEAKVKTPTEERTYIGLTASSFKTRYTSHKASFTHREKSNHTELSKYIWKLKDNSVPFNLIWSIKKHARPYNPRSKRCNLCLWEKYYIITSDKRTTLNSRSEIISTCRHKRKYLLSEYG